MTIKLNKYEHDLACPELRSMMHMMSRGEFGQYLANYREHILKEIEKVMKETNFDEGAGMRWTDSDALKEKIEEFRK